MEIYILAWIVVVAVVVETAIGSSKEKNRFANFLFICFRTIALGENIYHHHLLVIFI